MSGISQLLCGMVLLWGIAYFRLPRWLWAILIAAVLYTLGHYQLIWLSAWFLWPLLLLIVIPLNVPQWRRHLTSKVFNWFRGVLPPMSETEKQAIEAGDVWWEKELFQGNPHWRRLLKMPKGQLNKEEQAFIDNQVETLCDMLDDWKIVHEISDLTPQTWDYLKSNKFFGMIIPKEYGGLGFSPLAHSTVVTKIATRSGSAAVTVMVPNSLGPAELLLHYGTKEQKEYYLPRLAVGLEIPCFALTSPEAGSDAGAIEDVGVVCRGQFEGKETLGIRLTFDKRYITLAPVATVFGLAFKLSDPQKLVFDRTDVGITVCLIPTHHAGVEIGHRHFPLNMAFMNGPIRGTDVFIPLDWIIGGSMMAGQGWRMLMECLSAGRGISLPALSTATGILTYRMTGAYAAIRNQFNVPIGSFEGVEQSLGRIGGLAYTLQAVRMLTATGIGLGIKPSVATAIAKYHMTEMSRIVMNDAMDIHGGRGIMLGPSNYLGRGYQAVPVSITVEGANILTRSLMIFGQGAIRCHPYAFDEMQAAKLYSEDKESALKLFDKYFIKHVGYFISNFVRCITLSLTRGIFSYSSVGDKSNRYAKHLNWLSSALALSSDVALMTLGGDLKRKENLSARLGDVLSQLYIASAVIKYYHDCACPKSDWPMVEWSLQMCLYKIQEAFYGFFENFSKYGVGTILKWIIFPFGKAFTLPKDTVGQACAKVMLTNTDARSRLTALCYIGKDENDPTGIIEKAFEKLMAIEPVLAKIKQAQKRNEINKKSSFAQKCAAALSLGIINEQELQQLEDFEQHRKRAIAVDEFNQDYALGSQKQCNPNQVNTRTE